MRETLFCAIASTSHTIRAVLIRDGRDMARFFTSAPRPVALEEFSDFLYHNVWKAGLLSYVVFTGYGRRHLWKDLKKLLKEKEASGQFSFDILHGPDIQRILTMDAWFQGYPAFRRLELLAYLCSRSHRQRIDSPEQVHLEWVMNKTRDQLILVQQKLQEEKNADLFKKTIPDNAFP